MKIRAKYILVHMLRKLSISDRDSLFNGRHFQEDLPERPVLLGVSFASFVGLFVACRCCFFACIP